MKIRIVCCVWLGLGVLPGPAPAWWVKGHEAITTAAGSHLPEDVPAFFRAGAKSIGYMAGDPDRWKNRDAKFLRVFEAPDHYIDLENWQGKELPENRYKALTLVAQLGEKPESAGMLPYAIMEHFDRLTCAFYDYRQDPQNEAIKMKCIVYAGILSHYSGDTVMPLHTTRDFDGKKGPDGKTLQKGIHARIDGFPEKQGFTWEEIGRELEAKEIADVWKHVLTTITESHEHVGLCYELDAAGAFDKPTEKSREFIMKRCRTGAQFTMDLYATAWKRSATFKPPY